MLLFQLPEDMLYLILSYLDRTSLCRLSQVCKKFYHFTNRDTVWRRIASECINTGMTRQGTDMYPQIPLKERVKVSQNWSRGHCRREIMLKWKTNLLPWMQLDGDVLYLSQAADIGAYHLQAGGGRLQHKPLALHSGHREDVCRFVLTDTHLISAGGDGKIIVHHRRSAFCMEYSGHNQEVNCVDSRGGVIVSGSRDRTARVWALSSSRLGECLHTIPTLDRVWSVAISPSQSSFVTGTACCDNFSPLRIWDIERCQLVSCLGTQFRRGAGVLDIVFENPFQLLTCGYDTYIRYWDLRVSSRKCVMEWEEPHDSALYCIQSDENHMIASGSSYYGVVRLWDKRQTYCLQTFHLPSATSSPVYCLRFNTSHLYAALATALYALDFKGPAPRGRR
ncbi:F-box/WD repeat-containing protein 4 [Megalops cyprinoides]|uniref:F-box/WD repeat-containing protein 4 n=1 Tax=Megalops cyprinoides TaxID=118141 RepID=UPI001864F3E9|nr:F-box/WD repeat-containing protein 4 [Megalops cyprinoides]